jgi:plasmid stabilization system protein ParE
MAQVIWTEPALADLDAIADYIALDNPEAARRLVQRVFKHVEQLDGTPKGDPYLPSSVVPDTGKLSSLPVASFTALTPSEYGSST